MSAIRNICVAGAGIVLEHRKQKARSEAEAAGRAFQARMFDALRLGSDAYWEADSSGVIRNVVLHGSKDEALIRMLEGRGIQSLTAKSDTVRMGVFRNLALDAPAMDPSVHVVKLSGRRLPDESWQGIARLSAKGRDSLTATHARSVIEELESARDHEATLRRETELILDGLRILIRGRSSREMYGDLLDFLSPALEFEAAIILRSDWSGRVSVRIGTSEELLSLDWQAAGQSLFAIDEVAFALAIPEDLDVPISETNGSTFRSALAVKIRGGSTSAILLCLHTRPGFFGARHLGLGTRLSLVASQVFMNEEEREKVVEASKLATIGEMAAGIVHEINQPLTSMTLAVNNLKEMTETGNAPDAEKLAAKLIKLQSQIDRVTKIVANMRVLARRTDGALEPFGIDTAISEATGIIQHKLTKAKIALELVGEGGLRAYGNAVEFSQVILNLLSNAHDAIQAKSANQSASDAVERHINVSAVALDSQWIEIRVRDTGCGFPDKGIDKAFQPFFTTKEVGQGTGLGLSLSRRIVENMGGTIALSNWANGAEICLRLKRANS